MTDFQLEPSVPVGEIPQRVIDELRTCRRTAKDYAQAFGDACKQQAEKFGVAPSALRKFVVALEDDGIEKLSKEAEDIERLIGAEE